jgi:hypothetical protein
MPGTTNPIKASDLLPINRGDMVRGSFGEGKLVDVLYHGDTVRLIVETSVVLDPEYPVEVAVSLKGRAAYK